MTLAGFSGVQLAVLAALVFFAGIVDALAGGGGLITVPAYLAAGLSPALVLGTNKLGSSIGTTAAVFKYQRTQRIPWRELPGPIAACFVGSYIGASVATRMDPRFIRIMLLLVMPVLAGFLYFKRDFGAVDDSGRHGPAKLHALTSAVNLPMGFYDGVFGPGAGTFMALAMTRFCGYDLIGATARAKIFNWSTNLAALATFLYAGRVQLKLGLMMGAVSLLGNYAGSHLGVRGGAKTIRPAVLLVCAGLFVKLLVDLRR